MLDRKWLDELFDRQGFVVNMCADPACHEEHEVVELYDIEQAIVAATSQETSVVAIPQERGEESCEHLTDRVPYRGELIIVAERWDKVRGFKFCPECGSALNDKGETS